MSNDVEYDAIVVGSGATGGWAAKALCEHGWNVLVLEAGPELRDRNAPAVDPTWRERRAVQARHGGCNADTAHLFVDDVANPYTTPPDAPFDWIRGRQVGGRTLAWGGFALRLSDLDFKAASHDGFGDDWPIAYRDLAPYYDRIETYLGVWGTAEGIAHLPDGPYVAAAEMTAGERWFKQAIERRWSDRHVIIGRAIAPRHDRDARWTMLTSTGSTLADAHATGRLTLRPASIARSIVLDPDSGRACGVAIIDAQTRETYVLRANAIVVCASTIESVRLLLNSAGPRHPDGLGNSSGLLGRYLMDHTRVCVVGSCPRLPPGELGEAFENRNSIYIPRYRNVDTRQPGFLRGYQIFGAVQRAGIPRSGAALPFALSLHGEQLPRFENRISIDATATDAWGVPCAHIACRHSDNERAMAADAIECARDMAAEAEFEIERVDSTLMNPGWMIHEVGGARMGDDPRTSVVDPFNRVWDCPNVLVTDGACWVSGACQNPTLTMMAITVRACNRLVEGA